LSFAFAKLVCESSNPNADEKNQQNNTLASQQVVGSKYEVHVLGIAQLLQVVHHGVVHGRGATHDNYYIIGGRGQMLLDHIHRNEAFALDPSFRWLIQGEVQMESVAVVGSQRLQSISY